MMTPLVIQPSTAILFSMTCAIIALVCLVAYLADQVIRNNAALAEDDYADHAMCTAHVADVVSSRFTAVALRQYAEKWESVEEKANLAALGRDKYKPGGPSMPTIWLNQQADLLEGK